MNIQMKVAAALTLAMAGWAAEDRTAAPEPWKASELMTAEALAAAKDRPAIFHIGFPALYKGAHIAGSKYAGAAASKPEGIEALKKAVAALPRDKELAIYCGCCPWKRCPNIRPAYRTLKAMGFTKIRVLEIPTNLHTDWVEKGFPVERGA